MRKDMVIYDSPKAPVSEAIRTLRTSLTYKMNTTGFNTFLITSSSPSEGKSWVVSNLGIAFGQSKRRTLIIDCDLRRGRQHNIFGVNNTYGLSQALDSEKVSENNLSLDIELQNLIQKTEVENLYVLPAGKVPDNPSELLENGKIGVIIQKLKSKFDIILLDAPPVNIVTDTLVLCEKVDGVVIVCSIGITKSDVLLETKRKIQSTNANIVGAVVNRMPHERMKAYTKEYTKYSDNRYIYKRYGSK